MSPETSRKSRGNTEAGGDSVSPLAAIFPGETVALSNGMTVTVRPWGARAVIHTIPAMLGRLFARLMPLQGMVSADADWLLGNLPLVLQNAAGEIEALVLFSTGLPPEVLESESPPAGSGITGEEFLRLAEAVFRQNKGFFDGIQRLRRAVGAGLSGPPSLPPS